MMNTKRRTQPYIPNTYREDTEDPYADASYIFHSVDVRPARGMRLGEYAIDVL